MSTCSSSRINWPHRLREKHEQNTLISNRFLILARKHETCISFVAVVNSVVQRSIRKRVSVYNYYYTDEDS